MRATLFLITETEVTAHPRHGYLGGFRPAPLLPNQVYRFDPTTGSVKVVAADFDKCNGIAFSPDGKTAFVYVLHRVLC